VPGELDDNAHWQARRGFPIRDVTVWGEELTLGPATLSTGEVVVTAREVGVPVSLRFDLESVPVWFAARIRQWPDMDMRGVFILGTRS